MRRFHFSLKLKVAISYSVLFLLSCAVIFFYAAFRMQRNMLESVDSQLLGRAQELQKEYILAKRYERLGVVVPNRELPPAEAAAIENAFPGMQIIYVYKTSHVKGDFFVAFGCRDGQFFELLPDGTGAVQSRKVPVDSNLARLKQLFVQQRLEAGGDNVFFRVLNSDGSIWISSDLPVDTAHLPGYLAPDARGRFQDIDLGSVMFRVLFWTFPDGRQLEIGQNMTLNNKVLRENMLALLGVLGIVAAFSGLLGWLIARHFVAGLARIGRAMDRIAKGEYSHRLQAVDEDVEICELMDRFNRMNDETEKLMRELRRVTDNVAHDLRTPLTRITGTLELVLSKRGDAADYYEACVTAAEECANLRALMDDMLEITRTESLPNALHKTEFDLCELLREAHELMETLAEEKSIRFDLAIPSVPVMLSADRMKLQRMIANLLDNAFKFTEAHGSVFLQLKEWDGNLSLSIRDSGCGMIGEEQSHVFERFFRADRSRNHPGNGLGLSMVYAIVQAHGWKISLQSATGRGTLFTISIPLSPSK